MRIEERTVIGANTLIISKATGIGYNKIKWFDTKTKEAEIYVSVVTYELKEELFNKLKEKYKFEHKHFPKVACHDEAGKNGSIMRGANMKIVTVLVTLYDAIAVNKKTLEEIV